MILSPLLCRWKARPDWGAEALKIPVRTPIPPPPPPPPNPQTEVLPGIHSREPRCPAPSPSTPFPPLSWPSNDSSLSFPEVAPWTTLKQHAGRTHSPAAHLVGHPSTPGKKLHWRSDVDASFIQGGFRLANDSLVVPASGTYIVYFQVAFLGASCPAGDEPLFLSHRVLLFSDAYPEDIPLLSAHKAACPGAAPWYHFLRQGAAFALQKGDRLSTQTEGKMHLLAGPGALSFGAFAL
uniref:Lymphotoxin-alpha n=1 Tax=Pelusios castaneus TaxID=367368 RepID=A0A8C8REH0_9SAUR